MKKLFFLSAQNDKLFTNQSFKHFSEEDNSYLKNKKKQIQNTEAIFSVYALNAKDQDYVCKNLAIEMQKILDGSSLLYGEDMQKTNPLSAEYIDETKRIIQSINAEDVE